MGNSQSIDDKICKAIYNNNSEKLLEYINRRNEAGQIITHVQDSPTINKIQIINILLQKQLCSNVIPCLLTQNPDIYKTYENKSCMSHILEKDDIALFKLFEQNELINMRKISIATIDYYMNTHHSYNTCLQLLHYFVSDNISLQETPAQPINILANFITSYKDIVPIESHKVFKYILNNFSYLLHKHLLHDIFKNVSFVANMSDHNILSIEFIYSLLNDKYYNYHNEIDKDGDTLLSRIIKTTCSKKYMISDKIVNVINFLTNEGFSFLYVNPITEKSIKNIIMETNNIKDFMTKNCLSDLFNTEELFLTDVCNKSLDMNSNMINLYKNKLFTQNDYTGTGLHYILNMNTNISESIFNNANDINALDSLNRTFLDILLQQKRMSVVRFLIDNGANLNRISTFYNKDTVLNISPLAFACGYLTQHLAMYLINAPTIDLNFKNSDGTTALIMTAKMGKVGIVSTLYAKGANSKLLDNNGKTVLHYIKNSNLKVKLSKNVKVNDYYDANLQSAPPDEGASSCCKICMENQIDILFYPCKHALCCNTCYKQMKLSNQSTHCTLCKNKIEFILDFKL